MEAEELRLGYGGYRHNTSLQQETGSNTRRRSEILPSGKSAESGKPGTTRGPKGQVWKFGAVDVRTRIQSENAIRKESLKSPKVPEKRGNKPGTRILVKSVTISQQGAMRSWLESGGGGAWHDHDGATHEQVLIEGTEYTTVQEKDITGLETGPRE